MFTGIIQAIGRIAAIESGEEDIRLHIETGKLPLTGVSLGDSIATSGVCLTVTELPGDGFWADVSPETLSLTTLGGKGIGDAVNLETPCSLSVMQCSRFMGFDTPMWRCFCKPERGNSPASRWSLSP